MTAFEKHGYQTRGKIPSSVVTEVMQEYFGTTPAYDELHRFSKVAGVDNSLIYKLYHGTGSNKWTRFNVVDKIVCKGFGDISYWQRPPLKEWYDEMDLRVWDDIKFMVKDLNTEGLSLSKIAKVLDLSIHELEWIMKEAGKTVASVRKMRLTKRDRERYLWGNMKETQTIG